jgi:predicted DNA-binding protein
MKTLQDENKAVCFRLPIDQIVGLDKVATHCGLSRANLMRDIVSQYLDYAEQYILIKD